MAAPGIAISSVIKNMNRAALMQLLGDELVHTLERLDKTASEETLRKVAYTLYGDNDVSVLQNDRVRNQIIEALPLDKAKELIEKLKLSLSGNIYKSLKKVDFKSDLKRASSLYDFLGVVEIPASPSVEKLSAEEVFPKYGLFKHQRDVAARTHKTLETFPHKVVLHMPTGSGKTRTSMHIVCRHLIEHGPTLVCWLTNSAELLEQAAGDFQKSWSVLGDRPVTLFRFWGDKAIDHNKISDGVLVAGFSKLHAMYKRRQNDLVTLGDRVSLIVVDEAHQAIAATYRSIIEILYDKRPGNQLLGLTATPGRTWNDIEADAELSSFFEGNKITLAVKGHEDPVEFLISEGYLAKPIFKTLKFDGAINISAVKDIGKTNVADADLSSEDLEKIAQNGERNFLIVKEIERLLSRHKRIIFFGASVYHANLIAGLLAARGHEAKVITGAVATSHRESLISRFRSDSSRAMVMCNYGVLTTGFDAPKTSAAVIARPTKSLVLYSQMVGRATRGTKAGGNQTAEIVTVVDTALPGFGSVSEAFKNWEDVWDEQ